MTRAASDRPGVPTATYAEPERATEGYGSEPRRTRAATGTSGSTALELPPGEALELDGATFHVEDVISRRGAEATIYRIRDEAGQALVLKLYRAFARAREEPNPEALARVAAIRAPGVLRLHRFGAGARKLRSRYCYEVCDLAAGGDLLAVPAAEFAAKYTPEFVRRVVVPQLFEGLVTLQRHRIFHCDLKPQNLFWLDGARTRLTIGDYGSAKTVEEGAARGLCHTELVKGTDFYLAPEQARRIISAKNDYYSFGMVLVHLLRPELVSREGLGEMLRRQLDRRPPIDDGDGRLGDLVALIGGLTLYDPEARWGEVEVAGWLAGDVVEVRYRSDLEPIKVDARTVLRSVPELCAFLEREPTAATILVEDEVGLRDLKTWVARLEGLSAQRRFARLAELHRGRGDGEAAREALLGWFDPARPVQVGEARFDLVAATDPVAEAARAVRHLDRAVRAAPETAPRIASTALVGLERVLRHLGDGTLASRVRSRAAALCARIDAGLADDNPSISAPSPCPLPSGEGSLGRGPPLGEGSLGRGPPLGEGSLGRGPPLGEGSREGSRAAAVGEGLRGWDGVPRWFLRTGPEELMAIFYSVDPERGFIGGRGERADTLEELGLHLAAHPYALDSAATAREVRWFLAGQHQGALAELPRRELLFALLSRQLRFELRLASLTVDAAGFHVCCDVGRSLAELLRQSGLRGTGLDPTTEPEEHLVERRQVPWWRRLYRPAAAALLASAVLDSVRARRGLSPESLDSRSFGALRDDLARALRDDERKSAAGRMVLLARVALVVLPLLALVVVALGIARPWRSPETAAGTPSGAAETATGVTPPPPPASSSTPSAAPARAPGHHPSRRVSPARPPKKPTPPPGHRAGAPATPPTRRGPP